MVGYLVKSWISTSGETTLDSEIYMTFVFRIKDYCHLGVMTVLHNSVTTML